MDGQSADTVTLVGGSLFPPLLLPGLCLLQASQHLRSCCPREAFSSCRSPRCLLLYKYPQLFISVPCNLVPNHSCLFCSFLLQFPIKTLNFLYARIHSSIFRFFPFPFLFWMLCVALEIFVPLQGIEPMSRALGA